MKRKTLAVEISVILGLLIITSLLFFEPSPTGWITSRPGEVTQVDLSHITSNNYWHGVFGNLSRHYSSTSLLASQPLEHFNVALKKCHGCPLYATTLESIDWDSVVPAHPNEVNTLLGLSTQSPYSGTRIFDEFVSFSISNNTISLYAAKTKAKNGHFYTGLLKQDDTLIFVTDTSHGQVFNGDLIEYQIMLPAQSSEYNFFYDNFTIERLMEPPEFKKIEVQRNPIQDEGSYIKVWWNDTYESSVTLTSSISDSIITYPEESMAIINWTPGKFDVGYQNITLTITNTYQKSNSKTLEIFVENKNDPPVLEYVQDIDAYLHEPYYQKISAFDYDNLNNHPDNDTLEFFTIPRLSWLDIKTIYNASSTYYYGIINFTPVSSQKGTRTINISVTDGQASDTQEIELSVGYCGDGRCDSRYEDCRICPEDCGPCHIEEEKKDFAFFIERSKWQNTTRIKAHELVERATCDIEGDIIRDKEVCRPLADVTIETYKLINDKWEFDRQYSTDELGEATVITYKNETYRIQGHKDNYESINYYVGRSYLTAEKEEEDLTYIEIEEDEEEDEIIEPEVDQPREIIEKGIDHRKLWSYYGIVFSLVLLLLFYFNRKFSPKI